MNYFSFWSEDAKNMIGRVEGEMRYYRHTASTASDNSDDALDAEQVGYMTWTTHVGLYLRCDDEWGDSRLAGFISAYDAENKLNYGTGLE